MAEHTVDGPAASADEADVSRRRFLGKIGAISGAGLAAAAAGSLIDATPAAAVTKWRPMSQTVSAANAPAGYGALSDFLCTATATTGDDTPTITSAINALVTANPKNGGTVELSPGDFYLRTTLDIPSGITLRGQGATLVSVVPGTQIAPTLVHWDASAPTSAITIGSSQTNLVNNVAIRDLELVRKSGSSTTAITIFGAVGILLENITIEGFKVTCITATTWWDSHVRGCRFQDAGSALTPAVIVYSDTGGGEDSNSLRFTDCTFESNTSDLYLGLTSGGGGTKVNKIRVRGCKFEQLASNGSPRLTLAGTDYVVIDGCDFATKDSPTTIDSIIDVSNAYSTHITDCRFECQSTGTPLSSWLHFDGTSALPNIGVSLANLFFNTSNPANPTTACIVFSGTNQLVRSTPPGYGAVPWHNGGSAPTLVSGSPSSTY